MRHACAIALVLAQVFRPAVARAQASAEATRPSFSEFLAGIRTEALFRGIRPDVVDQALAGVEEPLAVVIDRDRAQAEAVFPLERYISRLLTRKFLTTARVRFDEHRALLATIAGRYGVSPGIIAGIWGLESNFGRFSGVRPTVAALATLAWDPRRSTLFRRELFDALEILNRGDIDPPRMRGSWAGAMGQPQFMPSSYLQYAEDFDGDGRRDIWDTPADVFASIANYLKGHAWTAGQRWGREVKVSREAAGRIASDVARRDGSCHAMRDMTVALPPTRWQELGVRLSDDRPLPTGSETASLVAGTTRHFLVNANYDALLEYNCSHSYAITVGLLADRIGAPAATSKKIQAPRRSPKTASKSRAKRER